MKKRNIVINLLLFVSICTSLSAQIDIEKIIPATWEVYRIIQIPSGKLPSFSAKLDGEIKGIKNYHIKTDAGEIQINTITGNNSTEAENMYKTLLSIHGSDLPCYKRDVEIFEFRSSSIELVKKAKSIVSTVKGNNNLNIKLSSIFVENQAEALKFYTEILGFVKKEDIPLGEFRWLTVVSADGPDYLELVLEPNTFEAVKTYQKALFKQGIPINAFEVDDIQAAYERLKKHGVEFTMQPTEMMGSTIAVFNDTCGNLIQIYQVL